MASRTITDRAVVLDRQAWRESDKRVVFYTRNHGKIDAVAIGAHKIRSKLAGHLEPLRLIDLMVAEGRQTHKIAQAVTVQSFVTHPIEPRRVLMQGGICRLVQRGTVERHSDPAMYELVIAALEELNALSGFELDAAYGKQLFLIAEHLGYAPQLTMCVVCARATDLTKFSSELGGVVCTTCRAEGGVMPYSAAPQDLHAFVGLHLRWRRLM